MTHIAKHLISKINNKTARIAIIGLGYVGLPTAVQFAEKGFNVIGVDINKKIVKKLTAGECHLTDLNISERVQTVITNGKLEVMDNTSIATQRSDIILIIVPTPLTIKKNPDLQPIISAGEGVAHGMSTKGKLIILESTVYPGLTEEILIPILEKSVWRQRFEAGIDFGVAHVPERYNPGDNMHGIQDVVRVVGAINEDWLEVSSMLYRQIVKDVYEAPDIKTAEAAKIIENIQRDLNIALMNELALIFEKMDIDVMEVIKAAKTKWNFNVYYPGSGVGGHCLTKDGLLLVQKAKEAGCHSEIILTGRAVNDSMPYHVLDLLIDALNMHGKPIKSSKIVVLGLSYKENIGDIRESPSLVLLDELRKRDADIFTIDPYIETVAITLFKGRAIKTLAETYEASKDADAIVLMTAHDEFKELDMSKIVSEMRTPILIDGRRIFDSKYMSSIGFTYRGIGGKRC